MISKLDEHNNRINTLAEDLKKKNTSTTSIEDASVLLHLNMNVEYAQKGNTGTGKNISVKSHFLFKYSKIELYEKIFLDVIEMHKKPMLRLFKDVHSGDDLLTASIKALKDERKKCKELENTVNNLFKYLQTLETNYLQNHRPDPNDVNARKAHEDLSDVVLSLKAQETNIYNIIYDCRLLIMFERSTFESMHATLSNSAQTGNVFINSWPDVHIETAVEKLTAGLEEEVRRKFGSIIFGNKNSSTRAPTCKIIRAIYGLYAYQRVCIFRIQFEDFKDKVDALALFLNEATANLNINNQTGTQARNATDPTFLRVKELYNGLKPCCEKVMQSLKELKNLFETYFRLIIAFPPSLSSDTQSPRNATSLYGEAFRDKYVSYLTEDVVCNNYFAQVDKAVASLQGCNLLPNVLPPGLLESISLSEPVKDAGSYVSESVKDAGSCVSEFVKWAGGYVPKLVKEVYNYASRLVKKGCSWIPEPVQSVGTLPYRISKQAGALSYEAAVSFVQKHSKTMASNPTFKFQETVDLTRTGTNGKVFDFVFEFASDVSEGQQHTLSIPNLSTNASNASPTKLTSIEGEMRSICHKEQDKGDTRCEDYSKMLVKLFGRNTPIMTNFNELFCRHCMKIIKLGLDPSNTSNDLRQLILYNPSFTFFDYGDAFPHIFLMQFYIDAASQAFNGYNREFYFDVFSATQKLKIIYSTNSSNRI